MSKTTGDCKAFNAFRNQTSEQRQKSAFRTYSAYHVYNNSRYPKLNGQPDCDRFEQRYG